MPECNVHDAIRRRLRDCRFVPGTKLLPQAVADTLGVSVIPVRECFIRFAECGMLNWVKNKGFFVPKFSRKQIIDDYFQIYCGILASSSTLIRLPSESRTRISRSPFEEIVIHAKGTYSGTVEEIEDFYRNLFRILDNPLMEKTIQYAVDRTHFYRCVDFDRRECLRPHFDERFRFVDALERRDRRSVQKAVSGAFERHLASIDDNYACAVRLLATRHSQLGSMDQLAEAANR